jgi:head-tail adaptor
MAFRDWPAEAGDRDRFVTIQQVAESAGGSGFPVETWSTLVESMPASRIDVSGRERMLAGQLAAQMETRWEINYREDMDPALVDVPKTRRLVFSGRVFDIVSAREVGRREALELMTIAGTWL